MKTMLSGLTALVLGLAVQQPAQAQWINRNKVINSGNGVGNTIAIQNRGGFPGYGGGAPFVGGMPGGYGGGMPGGYGGGMPVGYGGGYDGGYNPGFGGMPGGFPMPSMGGYNTNRIMNSGNGQGNTIGIMNGGGYNYSYPGGNYGGVSVGGVNVNVITNSGNGAGNSIGIMNR